MRLWVCKFLLLDNSCVEANDEEGLTDAAEVLWRSCCGTSILKMDREEEVEEEEEGSMVLISAKGKETEAEGADRGR